MLHLVRKLLAHRGGATAVEYAFVTVLVSIIFIAAVVMIGTQLTVVFVNIGNALVNAN
jgi:Flp pilus assembly pilin Flp